MIEVVNRQMVYYNTRRRHSSLAYRSPLEYLHEEGILRAALAEIGPATSSNPRAQHPLIP
jgi:hypothetical protein